MEAAIFFFFNIWLIPSWEGFAGQLSATVVKFTVSIILIIDFLNPIVYLFSVANSLYSPVPGLQCLMGVMRKQPNG